MTLRPLIACVVLCPLMACGGPEVTYKAVEIPDGDLADRSIRFTLQGTTIALGTSGTTGKDSTSAPEYGAAVGAGGAAGAAHGATTGCGAKADWTACLQGVSAVTALVAAKDSGMTEPKSGWIFVATPTSHWWGRVTDTYSLSSTPVGDDETLPKTVTVTWTDNLKNVIATTGTGAATGFMFGPIGGAVGATVGFVVATATEGNPYSVSGMTRGAEADLSPDFSRYVCDSDKNPSSPDDAVVRVDYKKIPTSALIPKIGLPVVLKSGPASEFYVPGESASGCWHPVPNNVAAAVGLVVPGAPTMRDPQTGDGWFYRIMTAFPPTHNTAADEAAKLVGPTDTTVWFDAAKKKPLDRFPVSTCEKATVQLTWWSEIAHHQHDMLMRGWHQNVEIANPDSITSVKIPKSGTINFRIGCGAYTTNNFNATPESDRITQLDSMIQTVIKAQSSSQTAPKTPTPKPTPSKS